MSPVKDAGTGGPSFETRGSVAPREEEHMTRMPAVLTACAFWLAPVEALCAGHVVTSATARQRLAAAAAERERDVRTLDRLLSRPAAALGTPVGRLRAGVRALNDAELRDLSLRATALQSDPVAAELRSSDPEHEFLVIFVILATVVLVLNASTDGR